jgi:DNA (cytosine-5)-methyltransferase 1
MMRELSLFSGGGGGVYGSKLLGWKTVGYVEYDDYCQRIIAQRIKDGIFDHAPIFGDIRTFATEYAAKYRGLVDVVTAGFPCQSFSAVGEKRGAHDHRNMWPQTLEVIRAINPQYAFLENVRGLLGGHKYFETILKDLSKAGYDAKWTCLSAAEVGAPHRRDRLWILATKADKEARRSDCCSGAGCCSKEEVNLNATSDRLQGFGRCKGGCGDISANKGWQLAGNHSCDSLWWKNEPDVDRVADGVASRRNRVKTLGNGQVPAVFAEAWRILNG